MKPETQRVTVSGLIFRDDRVLLLRRSVREKFLPGYFDLPGGKVDFGESPHAAILRETREKSGLTASIVSIYNCWNWISEYRQKPTQFISISFILEISEGAEPEPAEDFAGHIWSNVADLENLLLTPALKADLKLGFGWRESRSTLAIGD